MRMATISIALRVLSGMRTMAEPHKHPPRYFYPPLNGCLVCQVDHLERVLYWVKTYSPDIHESAVRAADNVEDQSHE